MADKYQGMLFLIAGPEDAVAVHAEFALLRTFQVDSADDIGPGAFGQQGIQLGHKDAVLEYGNASLGRVQSKDMVVVHFGT